jgi:hypothetical protein
MGAVQHYNLEPVHGRSKTIGEIPVHREWGGSPGWGSRVLLHLPRSQGRRVVWPDLPDDSPASTA